MREGARVFITAVPALCVFITAVPSTKLFARGACISLVRKCVYYESGPIGNQFVANWLDLCMTRRQEGCWTGFILAVAATCVFAVLLVRLKFHLIEQLEKDGA